MKNLFDKSTLEEVVSRLNNLTSHSQRQWGKMEVAQMLAHCTVAFTIPLGDKSMSRILIGRLLSWLIKPQLFGKKPFKKNSPTAPVFIIKDERNLDEERKKLLQSIAQFQAANPTEIEKRVHPFFGKFTGEQWGKFMYKHLDHHLIQFGV